MQQLSLILRSYCPLLLFFSLICNANRCPEPDIIRPYCSCGMVINMPTIRCSKVYQLQVLKEISWATGDRPFVWLEVADSLINFFPASALKEKNVRVLMIKDTTMVSLFERDPEENHKFYELNLIRSKVLRGIQWSQLRNLHNLTNLYAHEVTIRHFGKDFAENIPTNILNIRLLKTKTQTLHDEAFARLHKVNTIEIYFGKIKTLKRSMFPKENQIERLTFSHQEISTLPDDLFNDMPKLKAVAFPDNKISILAESVFKVLADRKVVVYLLNNPLVCDCSVRWAVGRSDWELKMMCDKPDHMFGIDINDLDDSWGCPPIGSVHSNIVHSNHSQI